jgi:phosphodiester glycosidase
VLPLTLAPPPPFPPIVAQSVARQFVAPGVEQLTYYLMTARGPLVVRAVSIDLAAPDLRVGAVIAHDTLTGSGETVSSMARRSGAVAGINADYFDIGQTNQPLNIVVRDGALLRTPSGRAVLSIGNDRTVHFGTYRFSGTVADGDRTWQLEGVDEWPPQGTGAMLLLPAFGAPPQPPPGVKVVPLAAKPPAGGAPSGEFHVTEGTPCASCPQLAFGVRASSLGALPQPGDIVHVNSATDPPLDGVLAAVGGGPLLVHGGAPYDDPDPPSPAEALQRDPQAGALRDAAGRFALVAVDGRAPGVSVGLTRPEFAALLRGLGADDGIAFDSGGSVSLVARPPGVRDAALQNVPSDGHERPVADGLLVYSTAPPGPATRLALPAAPLMLAGASLAVSAVATDAAGRPASAPAGPLLITVDPPALAAIRADGTIVARAAGSGVLRVRRGGLAGETALRVVASLGALRIAPQGAAVEPGGGAAFAVVGSDASGAPVDVDGLVAWSARGGAMSQTGAFRAAGSPAAADAEVAARVSGLTARAAVSVGRSERALPLFAAPARWTFTTYPAGGTGSAILVAGSAGIPPELDLAYTFGGSVRGAYANLRAPLPGKPLSFTVDVRGDDSGAGLRAAFTNADGDRIAVTIARRIDWSGWRTCKATLPLDAVPPLVLRSLYVVASLGGAPAATTGTVAFRNLRVTFAGDGTAFVRRAVAARATKAPPVPPQRGEEDS